MAPRYFGGRNPWAGFYPRAAQKPSLGGFNVGNVQQTPVPGSPPTQSSVASPNPASAGVSGTPASIGAPEFDESQTGGGGSAPGTASNANVSGFDPGLAGLGLGFASMGVPGLGAVTGPLGASLTGSPIGGLVGSMLGSAAQTAGTRAGLGAIPSGMVSNDPTTQGQQASYTGPTNPMSLLASLVTGNVPQVTTTDPTPFGLANQADVPIPSASPNMGFGVGIPGSTSYSDPTVQGLASFADPTTPTGYVGQPTGYHTAGNPYGLPTNPDTTSFGAAPTGGVSDTGAVTGNAAGAPVGIGDAAPASAAAAADAAAAAAAAGGVSDGGVASGDAGAGNAAGVGDAGVGVGSAAAAAGDAAAAAAGEAGADGGGGGAGGGAGSLLCNLALDGCGDTKAAKKHRRDLDAITERAFRSQPKMKESFKHYQAASKQIISKIKALSSEDQAGAFAMLQKDLVAPVTKAARRGDITAVGRSLRKITRKLAGEYEIKIPQEHITASEALIGSVDEDDKPYVPSGRILPPSRSRIDKLLEPAEPSSPEPTKPVKSAGVGGFGVGLS